MDAERLLLECLPDVELVAAFVCRRHLLRGADAEDFTSFVKLRLIENDYAILRKFKRESTLRTYLSVVIQRLLFDYRNHLLGKWRPSAEAKRLGAPAILLETLLHRDRLTLDEAAAVVQSSGTVLTRDELSTLAQRLPRRLPPRRHVALEEMGESIAAPERAESRILAKEDDAVADHTSAIIRRTIDGMNEQDRLILRMRYEVGMSVVQIARALGTDLTILYRRLYRNLATLRSRLEDAGVGGEDIERIISSADELDFGLAIQNRPDTSAGDEETPL